MIELIEIWKRDELADRSGVSIKNAIVHVVWTVKLLIVKHLTADSRQLSNVTTGIDHTQTTNLLDASNKWHRSADAATYIFEISINFRTIS